VVGYKGVWMRDSSIYKSSDALMSGVSWPSAVFVKFLGWCARWEYCCELDARCPSIRRHLAGSLRNPRGELRVVDLLLSTPGYLRPTQSIALLAFSANKSNWYIHLRMS
jgi:hypothetical protein